MNSQFNNCALEYHKFRPEYPQALFQFLIERFGLSSNSLIADVGCGTARGSIPFAEQKIPIIALDPSLEMLQFGKTTAKELNLPMYFIQSKAEQLCLNDETVSFVNCAQAFHWFDSNLALAEFYRILKPKGAIAIYWNNRDHIAAPYLIEVEELISKYNPKHKSGYRDQDWASVINKTQRFSNTEFYSFSHTSEIPIVDFIGLTQSFSYVRNVLDQEQTSNFEKDLYNILKTVSKNDLVWLPYQVKLWCASK